MTTVWLRLGLSLCGLIKKQINSFFKEQLILSFWMNSVQDVKQWETCLKRMFWEGLSGEVAFKARFERYDEKSLVKTH